MKKIIEFFKTSPLKWWQKTLCATVGGGFSLTLIIGGISSVSTNPKEFAYLSFFFLGGLIFTGTLFAINSPKMDKLIGADKGWKGGGEDYSWMKPDKDKE